MLALSHQIDFELAFERVYQKEKYENQNVLYDRLRRRKDGKYMLKNKKHPDGVELMSSDDLKPHVGHKINVTGMMQGDSAMSGDSMSKDNMAMAGFKVTSMKMVSEQCTMPDAMMKK
jgi:hypothetical protein